MMRIYIKIIIMISFVFSQDEPELFEYEQSTLQGFYFFNSVLINDIQIDSDDWVGAFKENTCVGARKWDTSLCGEGICDVPVMGNDGSEYTNGYMNPGEIPVFKIYDTSEGIYYNAESNLVICEWNISGFCSLEELSSIGELDCAGVPNGDAVLDECGVCDGNGVIQDCGCGILGDFGIPDGNCDCNGNINDCNGICGGDAIIDCNGECNGSTDCDINISLNPYEFDNLVLLTNLNTYEITDSICIDHNINLMTTGELNVQIGDCVAPNNQQVIPLYISNQFYITNFNISLTGLNLDSSTSGANGGLIDYIGYDWDIIGNTISGQLLDSSEFIINLTSDCTNSQSCNYQTANINDENLCLYPLEYWFDLDLDGLGYGNSSEYCLDNLPEGWVLNNDDICPNDPNNDEDQDGLCSDEDEYPNCYYNEYDCTFDLSDESTWIGACGGSAFIDDCETCVGGNTGLGENYLNIGCGCNLSAPQNYWADVDQDGLGSGTINAFCLYEIPNNWILADGDEDPYPDCYDNFYDECGVCGGDGIADNTCDCAGNLPIEYCIDIDGDNEGNIDPNTWIFLCENEYLNAEDLILIPVQGGLCIDSNEACVGEVDNCGVCDGGNQNQDCNNDCFGNAEVDYCDICAGGNTGLIPNADQDDCGECNGGNAAQDCLGNCFGDAEVDDCGECNGMLYLDENEDLYNGLFCDCELTSPNNCGECIEEPCEVSVSFANLNNDYKNFIEVPIYLNGYSNNSIGLEGIEFEFEYNNNYYDLNILAINEELLGYTLQYNNYTLNDSLNKVEVIIYASEEPLESLNQNDIVNLRFTLNSQDGNYSYMHDKTTDLTFVGEFKIGNNIIETENGLVKFKTIMCLDSVASNFCNNEDPTVPSIPEDDCTYYTIEEDYIIFDGLCEYIVQIDPDDNGMLQEDLLLTNGDNSIELFIDSETILMINDAIITTNIEISFLEFYDNNIILPEPPLDEDIPLRLWGEIIAFEPYEITFQDETGQVTINITFPIYIGERDLLEYSLYKIDDLNDTSWELLENQDCGVSACSAQINSFGLYSVVVGGLGCTNIDACNFNANATVDDGSCSYPDDDPDLKYCYDEDGDSYGENPDSFQYFCPDGILDNWVSNCDDPEPNCQNPNPEILLIDNCGICNGDNACFEYPNEFINSWILMEQNEYLDSYCFEDDENPPISAPFITNSNTNLPENIFSDINLFADGNGFPLNSTCLTYKMNLEYTEPCQWNNGNCQKIDDACISNDNQELCENNNYCYWESDYCIEVNNNCININIEEDCTNIDYSNQAQLICVTNEIYDEEFGGGWIYGEELSAIFEWGVADNQLCFNEYGINNYECIDYIFADDDNEIHLQNITNSICSDNTYKKSSYLGVNSNLIPNNYRLYANYPNPFNPVTNISFDIPKAEYISLNIYNINGQHVKTLVDDQYLVSGHYDFEFNGKNLSSGIYFVILYSEQFIQSNKMVLIK